MVKTKNSPLLICDICGFKVANSYIFKRHLHRCFSLHGVASKRSTSRNPVRLQGTEGLLNKELSQEDIDNEPANSSLLSQNESSSYFESVVDDESEHPAETSQEEAASTVESNNREGSQNILRTESDPNDSPLMIPGAPYSRHYGCSDCPHQCKSSREHLLHMRNAHGHVFKIYACNICDYASRYINRVERHMIVHKQLMAMNEYKGVLPISELTQATNSEKQNIENSTISAEFDQEEATLEKPKIQPLKLKRLNIRMPFKVSMKSKLKSGSSFLSSTRKREQTHTVKANSAYKELYQMIVQEDGSHHFQCRDCLYYASMPSSIKKHHALCHSRLLCCPHCSLSTKSQGKYYEHLITHQGHGYMKCPDCSYVTCAKSNLEKHRSFHGGDFPVRCTVCSFGADSESKIKRHVATQHMPDTDATITEELEAEDLSHESNLTSEENDNGHQMLESLIFNEGAADLEQEMTVEDIDNPTDGSERTGLSQVEYRCPKCPMICYRRGNFTRHLTARHKYSQMNAASLSKTMENNIFKGKKGKSNVLKGLKKKLAQPTQENLKCPHCSYIAKWPSDLRRHKQVHTIVKRFKCSMCTNKYKYIGDMNVHMRRDHDMEPPDSVASEVTSTDALTKASPAVFRCPVCPFSSHSKAELEQHSRYHGNTEKTYQCRLCEYQTYWRGDVSRHLFRHHQVILSKEGTEIGEYFVHRPDIKPLNKQGPSPSVSLQSSPEAKRVKSVDDLTSPDPVLESSSFISAEFLSSGKKNPAGPSPVFLKEGSFVCEYQNCDFKTTISDRMEAHLAVHQNLKQFMCPTCGKRTNWKWDVVKHMHKVHMNPSAAIEDVITLGIDDARASIQGYMQSREKKAKDLSVSYCSLCAFKSMDRNRVIKHLATVHRHESGQVLDQSLHGPARLSVDHSSRRASDNFTDPLPAPKFSEPPPEELAQFEKPYACAICKKPGSTKGDVKKHYNYSHPYKDVRILYVGNGTEFNYYTGEIYNKAFKLDHFLDPPEVPTGTSPTSPAGKTLRPDSKFSNPKMHGYIKPFKCSICGLRSNWKWDLKKHLRTKHSGGGGFVILLSIEEASETYGRDCSFSHPKHEEYLSIPGSPPTQAPTQISPGNSVTDHIFKSPLTIKEEILESSSPGDSSDDLSALFSLFSQSPLSSPSPSPQPQGRGREPSTAVDPSRRQWKCSGCNYISNWRRNMARHIHRKHPGEVDTIQILPLHDETGDFMNSESSNGVAENEEPPIDVDMDYHIEVNYPSPCKKYSGDMRVWNCSKCNFSSKLRTHIIVHMQSHDMKPFQCSICGILFMNRGPLHRHLQKIHRRHDYLKLCKVVIQYDDENVDAEERNEDFAQNEFLNSYFCRLCNKESSDRQVIVQHLAEAHDSTESDNVLKMQKRIKGFRKKKQKFGKISDSSLLKLNKKLHFCQICPFRTQKKTMLTFHMTYHRPSAGNKFKCKYCPYYVSALRLLHQHQHKWHKDSGHKMQWDSELPVTPTGSPSKHQQVNGTSQNSSPRRHCCEKCPYTTNSRNDFIYHKQFHRPKRSAEFKCEYCDYWVVHKRLLKQHVRLHADAAKRVSSTFISPTKSLCSDPGLVYDPLELAELASIKQQMISAKITASLSTSPTVSPMKLASQCSVDNKPGFIMKNGLYRKLHKCRFCPYTNIRSRNMQLHEMMHGARESNHPLMKCPHCDYYVGSKGLLSHHMKVHQKNDGGTPDAEDVSEVGESLDQEDDSDLDIQPQHKVDTLLQISRFKRYGCERCPYASAKRQHFVRHLELHGSRQRYTCQYCDYSVPSNNLLLQHIRLHMLPNQNLLGSQSLMNLQHLTEVPADVALASALPPTDSETAITISVIHDHLALYENSIYDPEPKKLYRCDRCPYANVRRDYLLSHLKFHMVPSPLVCPYCDYSAPKQPLLTQHIRVHFCPLPELSDWLLENGQTGRETSHRNLDLSEALKVAHEYQNQSKKKEKGKMGVFSSDKKVDLDDKTAGKENIQNTMTEEPSTYICQYCDRRFPDTDKLVSHELQHLIGNHFQRAEYMSKRKQVIEQTSPPEIIGQEQQDTKPTPEDPLPIMKETVVTAPVPLPHKEDVTQPTQTGSEETQPKSEDIQQSLEMQTTGGSLSSSSIRTSSPSSRTSLTASEDKTTESKAGHQQKPDSSVSLAAESNASSRSSHDSSTHTAHRIYVTVDQPMLANPIPLIHEKESSVIGTNTDQLSLTQQMASSVVGTNTDLLSVTHEIASSVIGTNTDQLSLTQQMASSVIRTNTDQLSLTQQMASSVVGTNTDQLSLTHEIVSSVVGTNTDLLSLTQEIELPVVERNTDQVSLTHEIASSVVETITDQPSLTQEIELSVVEKNIEQFALTNEMSSVVETETNQ